MQPRACARTHLYLEPVDGRQLAVKRAHQVDGAVDAVDLEGVVVVAAEYAVVDLAIVDAVVGVGGDGAEHDDALLLVLLHLAAENNALVQVSGYKN